MSVSGDAPSGGNATADVDYRAPLGEAGTELEVLGESFPEAIQALGDLFPRRERKWLGAGVDLDAGNDALLVHVLRERCAVLGLLAQRFVVQDDAADEFRSARRREQQFTVSASGLFGALHIDRLERLLTGSCRFVRGK